jgi:hypothetical protein
MRRYSVDAAAQFGHSIDSGTLKIQTPTKRPEYRGEAENRKFSEDWVAKLQ